MSYPRSNGNGLSRAITTATAITSGQTLSDRVRGNQSDLFSFSLSDRSSLGLKFKSAGAGATVRLFQDRNQNGAIDQGEILKSFASRPNKIGNTQIADLAAGDYFIQVSSIRQGNSSYRLSLSTAVASASGTSGRLPNSTSSNPTGDFAKRVVDLTNNFRLKNNLAPLTLNSKLTAVAQAYSKTMATQDFVAHQGLDGSQPWDRMTKGGYKWSRAAENIAAGQTTPETVMQSWIDSPGHRANLLDPKLKEIGVGYFFLANDTGNVNYNAYWTQDFGAPA